MKEKRLTAYFTFVHFDKSDSIIEDIEEYVGEELDCINNLLPNCKVYSDTIDWHFSDEHGNKVEMEDASTNKSSIPFAGEGHDESEERFRVYFSRLIESDCQDEDAEIEAWMLTDDYYIESKVMRQLSPSRRNLCEHNNTITNECSDCNEQELFDDILEHTLTGIMDLLTDTHNVVPDIIDDYQKHGGMQTDDIKIKVEQEIYRRLNNMKGE